MKPKKIVRYCLMMIMVFLLFGTPLMAAPTNEQSSEDVKAKQEEVINYGVNLLDWDKINELESQLQSAMPDNVSFHLKEVIQELVSGKSKLSIESIIQYLMEALFSETEVFIQFGARFVLIVLLCNLLQALSSSFKAKDTAKVGFFVCYMVILLSVVQSFNVMIQLAIHVVDNMIQIMMVCIPILLAFMAASGFNLSAGVMAPIIITALSMLSFVIKVVILPCIVSVVVLEVISAMSEEFKVSKLVGLFYKGLKWALKGVLIISVSLLSFYRFLLPGVDTTVKKATVKFSTAFIPVVGNAVGGTIDFITQGAMIVKNSFSAGIVLWIIIIASIPMIKIFAYVLVYQIAGAVIEPIGDKKMANIATKLAKGCQFIMSSVGIVALFCICTLVICMTINSAGA